VTANGTKSPITVAGLTNGTAYTFSVTAINAVGSGSTVISPSVITPIAASPTAPGATTGITLAKTSSGAVVSFTPPTDNGGSTVTGYTVIATPLGGGPAVQASGTSSPISLSGLTLGTTYTFAVVASNAFGTAAAASSTSSTPLVFVGTQAQEISFKPPADLPADSDGFQLVATTSSGLPVTFTIVNGPALLVGNTVTLTGGTGIVVVRASQSGDGTYAPAPNVTTTFLVTAAPVDVYFGSITNSSNVKSGEVAAVFLPKSNQCSMLIVAPLLSVNSSLTFTVQPNGRFIGVFTVQTVVPAAGLGAERQPAAALVTYNVSGQLINGRIKGVIDPIGVAFDTEVLQRDGPSAASAGFYKSTSLGITSGTTFAVVGPGNQVLTLAQTPEVTTGGLTTLKPDNTLQLTNQTSSGAAVISLSVDPATTSLQGDVSVTGKITTAVAGLRNTTLPTARLISLSSRGTSGNGRTLICGVVITGTESKRVLVRAVGPALTGFGVAGALTNPSLKIYNSEGQAILDNDDWIGAQTAASFAQTGAFNLPEGSKDAALVTTLAPGAYTLHILSSGPGGVALAEIYDASVNPNAEFQRLLNISTRGEAGIGENVLIGGFVVTGNAPVKVLIRGTGPALAAFGVPGVLVDPRLRVYRDNVLIAENDNWSADAIEANATAQAALDTGAFALSSGSKDAAMILTLAPGAYTAQVSSPDGVSTGNALVEIYEIR
jgi:hypothetical protein